MVNMSLSLGSYKESSLVLLQAVTPLHVGAGRTIGTVDLPIQRDAFGYPLIPSSSIKGSMRARLVVEKFLEEYKPEAEKLLKELAGGKSEVLCSLCQKDKREAKLKKDEVIDHFITAHASNDPLVKALFGPPPEVRSPEEAFTGAVAILDGKLLAIPARSLRGVWTYAITPQQLRALSLYLDLVSSTRSGSGSEISRLRDLVERLEKVASGIREDEVLVSYGFKDRLSIDGKVILNEEFSLDVKTTGKDVEDLTKSFVDFFGRYIRRMSDVGLVVVSDDIGREIVERSIIRQRRIRIKPGLKVVEEGALWSEESVPEFTTFVTVFLYSETRKEELNGELKKALEKLTGKQVEIGEEEPGEKIVEMFFEKKFGLEGDGYLVLGGHETVGRGIVKLVKVSL